MSDYPPPLRPYWTRDRAVARVRDALTQAPAGPQRVAALDALGWLERRLVELERAVRSEEDTREVPP